MNIHFPFPPTSGEQMYACFSVIIAFIVLAFVIHDKAARKVLATGFIFMLVVIVICTTFIWR